jgi:hypothetical protein
VADASTIASLATAGGTLVLAIATFSSTRSANRSARISEQALKAGLRPVLFNARPQDPPQKVGFMDDHYVMLRDGLVAVQERDGNLYLSIPLRNVGPGMAVLHAWYIWPRRATSEDDHHDISEFRRHSRDLYVPPGDIGFWQAALRDREDPWYDSLRGTIASRGSLSVDLLYGDHEGGQRTITRFFVQARRHDEEEPWLWICTTSQHWNLDRPEPR